MATYDIDRIEQAGFDARWVLDKIDAGWLSEEIADKMALCGAGSYFSCVEFILDCRNARKDARGE